MYLNLKCNDQEYFFNLVSYRQLFFSTGAYTEDIFYMFSGISAYTIYKRTCVYMGQIYTPLPTSGISHMCPCCSHSLFTGPDRIYFLTQTLNYSTASTDSPIPDFTHEQSNY